MPTRFFLFVTSVCLLAGSLTGCTDTNTVSEPVPETEETDGIDAETTEADQAAVETSDGSASTEEEKHYAVTGTSDNFAKLTASEKPVMVDYWAVWCGPCMMISPKVEELAKKLEGKAVVVKVNIDEQPELVSEDIEGYPYFAFYKDGKKVDHVLGLPSLDLEEAAQALEDKLMALADDTATKE